MRNYLNIRGQIHLSSWSLSLRGGKYPLYRNILLPILILIFALPALAQETTITPPVRPIASTTATEGDITLERLFTTLQQGQVGLLRLDGEGIQEGRVLFRTHEYPFWQTEDDGWYALVVADIDAQPRTYPISVVVRLETGETHAFEASVAVESAEFIRQLFEVPPNIGYLIDPHVERNEFARIDALVAAARPERLWGETGFILPLDTQITSGFGQYRILNNTVQTRHTGWDQSAPVGTPIVAIASGEVVFADQLDIRGNYLLIDHGWGVYTGYAHLSQINVERGQRVEQGEVIGASGNTGRSGGPHLHWEIAVNGEWVDGALLLETWLP